MRCLKEELYQMEEEIVIWGTEYDRNQIYLFNILDYDKLIPAFKDYIKLYYEAHNVQAEILVFYPFYKFGHRFWELRYFVEESKRTIWRGDGRWTIDTTYAKLEASSPGAKFKQTLLHEVYHEIKQLANSYSAYLEYFELLMDGKKMSDELRDKMCKYYRSKSLSRLFYALRKHYSITDRQSLSLMEHEVYKEIQIKNMKNN